MGIQDVVSELELEMKESQNSRDKRVEELWRKLDPQGKGELDLKGLQKGLRRIDHPMMNADEMLKDIVKAVDTSGDGKIQYEEFRVFVETAERKLLLLFRSIDRDNDGKLGKEELQSAFRKSGLTVSSRRLTGFFDEIDMNNDGFITFEEWRDFLLFMPAHTHDGDGGAVLEKALSFYSQIVTLNAEGDSLVSEDTLEGLGTTGFLLHALFGSILKLAQPSPSPSSSAPSSSSSSTSSLSSVEPQSLRTSTSRASEPPNQRSPVSGEDEALLSSSSTPSTIESLRGTLPTAGVSSMTSASIRKPGLGQDRDLDLGEAGPPSPSALRDAASRVLTGLGMQPGIEDFADSVQLHEEEAISFRLTEYLPEPGYFLAGAIAGGVSRTATAPLDRLKVYLLVNITTKPDSAAALAAATDGHPVQAARKAATPIRTAVASLYRSGGLRTFFAGNGLNVIKIMPETAIKFGTYEFAKRTLASLEGQEDANHINPYSRFVAGGLAGMVAQFSVYPLDTLKFRLQCETVQGGLTGNALLVQTAKKMYANGGVRAAYRGLTMGLVGMFPYSAIDMGTFELLKATFRRYKARYYGIHEEDAGPGNVMTGIMGATSGAFGASVVYPLNVLRTRLQTQGTFMHPPTYTGIWDVARKTIRNEGVRGLYKGLTPNLLKVAPALSITWIVYENSKKFLNLH